MSNKAKVVSAKSHTFRLQKGQGVGVLDKENKAGEERRLSLQIDNDFFLGLNIAMDEVTLDENIGKGTFGEVFKGHVQGKRVAVKQMFMNPASPEERVELMTDFGKECRIMSMIRHPNIVQFYGSVQEAPNFCIISELCEGNVVDLLNLLSGREINVTWRLLWGIANGAASALNYLHFENETQIIHRDVKAENLLLNEKFVCKLTDFGLSRVVDIGKNNQAKHMTMCGTPSWVAPEIFKGEAYNQKIDVYSYGIVLWELFCFRKPYRDEDPVKLPYKVALDNKRPPLAPHIPQKFAALMGKCWAPTPSDRPEFPEVLNVLQGFTKEGEDGLNVDLDAAVDVTKISNDLYTMKRNELRDGEGIQVPGAIEEESGDSYSPPYSP
ncbi:hypothetical protein TrVE_jg11870 [Triparma verrucosa]|uniref:Protein kinase domain-containing protein n=1 Tax=Triparma verrucosa TaxID=1606542 RepID=A0A9W7F6W9_9STRA|nr:hypothetical protein TrVE_jg11870 [Triparma verrucosa]